MRALGDGELLLEPQTAAHAEAMFTVLCDPALYAHENEPPPSLEWLRERFIRLESRRSGDGRERWLNWVIRSHEDPPIGYVQATVHAHRHASIAYVLSSAHWHRGVATRAVRLMLEELSSSYGVKRFTAVLKRGNVPSRRLLERLGFTAESAETWGEHAPEGDELLMCRAA